MVERRAAALAVMWRTVRHRTPPGEAVGDLVRALPRLLRATACGTYRGTAALRLLAALAGAGYVLSPVDVAPEVLLGLLGTVDDAVVAAWAAGTLLEVAEDFVRWERETSRTVPGEVVPEEVVPGEVVPGEVVRGEVVR